MSQKPATKPLVLVPGQTHLYRRGARYYFRMVVPEPLRRIVGKTELVESLNTSDFVEAKRLLPERIQQAHIVLDTATLRTHAMGGTSSKRRIPKGVVIFPSPLPPEGSKEAKKIPRRELPTERRRPLVLISEEHAQAIARQYFVQLEREGARNRAENRGKHTPKELQNMREAVSLDLESVEGSPENGVLHASFFDDGRKAVWRYLEQHNLTARKDSPDISMLARLFREAQIEHYKRKLDHLNSKPSQRYSALFEDLSERSPEIQERSILTLETLCERFLEENRRAGKAPTTLKQHRVAANLLYEIFGKTTPAISLRRADAERYCSILETIPTNRTKRYPGLSITEAIEVANKSGDSTRLDFTTRRNRYFSASAIFDYAVMSREFPENPFDDELLRRRCTPPPQHTENAKKERPPFTIEEINRIFSAPLFNSGLPPQDRTARFWVPLICLFQGTRQSEVCQLRTEDVVNGEKGLYFDLRWAEGRRLKNSASRRSVPIHPQILAMGFASYLEVRRADTENIDLFPELVPSSPEGSYGTKMSKWFARFLRQLPGPAFRATFHSFRNNFTIAAQKAGVSEDRINRICGWSSGFRQQRDYARDKFLAEHAEEIAKVRFEGLDLPHLGISETPK